MGNSPIEHHKNNIYSEVKREMLKIDNFEQLYNHVSCELNKLNLNIKSSKIDKTFKKLEPLQCAIDKLKLERIENVKK